MLAHNRRSRVLEISKTELVLLRFLLQEGSVKSLLRRHKDVLLENNPNFTEGREGILSLAQHMHRELCGNNMELG